MRTKLPYLKHGLWFPLFLLTIMNSDLSHAQVIRFQDTRCVPRNIQSVHDYLTDYSNYHIHDNHLRMSVPQWQGRMTLQPRRIIDMSESHAWFHPERQRVAGQSNATDAMIWIVMQVTLLRENREASSDEHPIYTPSHQALFPRFFLRCQTTRNVEADAGSAEAGFTHACRLADGNYNAGNASYTPFAIPFTPDMSSVGLNSFSSDLRVDPYNANRHSQLGLHIASSNPEARRACQSGDTVLSYQLAITPNPEHAVNLRDSIITHFYNSGYIPTIPPRFFTEPVIRSVLTPLFDPRSDRNFYRFYYSGFYEDWVRTLSTPQVAAVTPAAPNSAAQP